MSYVAASCADCAHEPHSSATCAICNCPSALSQQRLQDREARGLRAILVSDDFAEFFRARTDTGARLSVVWGEPDAEGFYVPTLTATDDGKMVVDRAVIREIRETLRDRGQHGACAVWTETPPDIFQGDDRLDPHCTCGLRDTLIAANALDV